MFDWDGVLADSLDVFTSVFVESCRQCHYDGFNEPGRLMGLFDGNMYETMGAMGLDRQRIGRILDRFRQNVASRIQEIRLFDGVAPALDAIARRHTVTIITSNVSAVPLEVLEREGIRCVAQVLGVDVDTSKIRKIRQVRSRYPDRPACYVGDTKGDMLEGREAGVLTVAVAWGWHGMEKLEEAKPDYRVASPEALAALLGCGSYVPSTGNNI